GPCPPCRCCPWRPSPRPWWRPWRRPCPWCPPCRWPPCRPPCCGPSPCACRPPCACRRPCACRPPWGASRWGAWAAARPWWSSRGSSSAPPSRDEEAGDRLVHGNSAGFLVVGEARGGVDLEAAPLPLRGEAEIDAGHREIHPVGHALAP